MIVSLIFQFDPIFRCAWCAQCTVYIVPFCKVWKRKKCYFEQKERKKERPKLNCVIKHRHNRSVCIKNDRIISTILKYQFQWWFSKKNYDQFNESRLAHFIRFITISPVYSFNFVKYFCLTANWISFSSKISSHLSFLQAHIRWRFGHLAFNDLSSGCNNSNWNILIMSSLKKTPSLLIEINGDVNSATEFSEEKKHPNKRNKIEKNTRKSFSISLIIACVWTWDLKNDHISQTTLVMKWSLTNAP